MKKSYLAVLALGATVALFGGCYFLEVYNGDQQLSQKLPDREMKKEDAESTFATEGMKWRMLAWVDENGDIPDNPITEALDERDYHLAQLAHPDGFSDGGVTRLNWNPRGPTNVGGRTRAMVIHPTQTHIMWAASVSGGVWKSINGGQSWMAANGRLQNYAVATLALAPNASNPNNPILYAGTGEQLAGDGLRGDGIFKSTDGGANWVHLGATRNWHFTSKIAVSADGNTLLASTTGSEEDNRTGIVRSTDGGSTWEISKDVSNSRTVVFHPTDSNKAVAEIITDDCDTLVECHKVIYSTDAGLSWSDSTLIEPTASPTPFEKNLDRRVELTYAKSDPNVVFAMHYEPCSVEKAGASISRSTNGGVEFTKMDTAMDFPFTSCDPGGGPTEHQQQPIGVNNYNNALWAWDENLVVAGGVFLHRSGNGGNKVRVVAQGDIIDDDPHVDTHCIVPDPGFNDGTNKRVYICNDGGVYKTENIRTATFSASPTPSWKNLNTGYQTTQFYGAAGNGTTGLIYGGTQDNAHLRLNLPSTNALFAWGGDGGGSAVDPDDQNFCYGEFIGIVLHRSTSCAGNPDGSITDIDATLTDISPLVLGGKVQTSFVNRFVLDPNDATENTMLYGGRSLWKTVNVKASGQPSWFKIKDNGNDVVTPSPTPYSVIRITALAVAPTDPDVIWVAESDLASTTPDAIKNGRLYRMQAKAEPLWVTVDDNDTVDPLPNRYLTRIAIDPSNPEIVYAAFGGFEPDNLWRTNDAGATWNAIPGGAANFVLPRAPIRGIAIHPNNPSKLYVGTEIGVYVSEDTGLHWRPVMEGPANVSVDELVFMSGNSTKLIAATHGRGIWTTDVNASLIESDSLYDFDGDGRSDISLVRPSGTPTWHLRRSIDTYHAQPWGLQDDKIAAEDFDGDDKTDITVFRPSDGKWYRIKSSDGTIEIIQFGQQNDIPVPADFDGDDKADEAVFRQGTWHVRQSTGGVLIQPWGLATDTPIAADFDGDGRADFGVFRQIGGMWYLFTTIEGPIYVQYGQGGDVPVVADYDGDGKADIAQWRPSEGNWYLRQSTDGETTIPWGISTDIPVPADYDGDGKADVAVWRPSDGNWYLLQSTNGQNIVHFGASGDIPIAKH